MTAATLDDRTLGRATLARQWLLDRAAVPPVQALHHLLGLQAQTPQSWYVGLWSRLAGFRAEDLSQLLEDRAVVRIALMRSTIHLVTADDAAGLRAVVQPVIERGTVTGRRSALTGLEPAVVAAAARAALAAGPLGPTALGAALAPSFPDHAPADLAMAARLWLPLVQTPPRGRWRRSGAAAHSPADSWLGRPVPVGPPPPTAVDALVLRYLAAFGPASPADAQDWSGLTRLREVFERLRPQLVALRTAGGAELYDLPDAPRPEGDVPAPVRFLYDFDDLLLGHADRSRFLTPDFLALPFGANGIRPSAVLVDGRTAATWRVEGRIGARASGRVLEVRLLARQPARTTDAIAAEGSALAAFLHDDAPAVRVLAP